MIVIMDHAPLMEEAFSLIESGCTELLFPFASETTVARYAESLRDARDLLVTAGVQFSVSNLVVEW